MDDLLLIMSNLMPEEMILDELQKALTEYRATGDGKSKLAMFCSMVLMKEITDKNGVVEPSVTSRPLERQWTFSSRMINESNGAHPYPSLLTLFYNLVSCGNHSGFKKKVT